MFLQPVWKLKDCPFCGSSKIREESWEMVPFERHHLGGTHWYNVWCDSCMAQGPDEMSQEEAEIAWNRRPE